jgi:hypothetical protein
MDLAYDQIRESTESKEEIEASSSEVKPEQKSTLNADLQDAYRAFSSTTWGASIGGFFGNVMKHVGIRPSIDMEAGELNKASCYRASRSIEKLNKSLPR